MRYKVDLGYKYPSKPDQHMLKVKHIVDTHFDENYLYDDRRKRTTFIRRLTNFALRVFGFLLVTIRHGLKIEGRENIKSKQLRKHSAITICNHVLMWDYLCVLKAIRPKMQHHPAWPINFEGGNRNLIKAVGGVPIPSSKHALVKFNQALNAILNRDEWLHFFPEGSLWFYYDKIRPIKKGCFHYAVNHNCPIIPMAISYRKAKGLYKLFKGNKPLITLRIAKPIYPDTSIPRNDAVTALHKASFHQMQILAGIDEHDADYLTYEQSLEYGE